VPLRRRQPSLVGREQELATLLADLAVARQVAGGVGFVFGEPGIGKTRLLTELAERAHTAGTLVLLGHAYDSDAGLPYGPFVEALRGLVRAGDSERLWSQSGSSMAGVAVLLPELADRLPDPSAGRAESPELDRPRLFDAVTELLFAAAHSAPGGLLLVLEDLHWADAASLVLLQHLGRRLAEAPLQLVLSYRTVEVPRDHPLHMTLAELSRQQPVTRLRLPPLPEPAVASIIGQLSGAAAAPQVAARVYASTAGNPFYVTELVRQLVGEGVDLSSAATAGSGWRVPIGLREVIGSRLARLSAEAGALLEVAAVLAEGARYEVLLRLCGGTASELMAPLEEVEAAGLLQEHAGIYDFAHALIRQTLLEELSLPRRQLLHLRAAEAIEQVAAGNLAPHLAALADHYRLAGAAADGETAIDYLLRAGEAAQGAFAYEEAASSWQAALERLTAQGAAPKRRADLLLRLGQLLVAAGFHRYRDAIVCLEQAIGLYEEIGESVLAGRAHGRLGRCLTFGNAATQDLSRAMHHLQTAAGVLGDAPATVASFDLYAGLHGASWSGVQTGAGLHAAERMLAIAGELGRKDFVELASYFQGLDFLASGRLREGLDACEQMWAAADRRGDPLASINASWVGNVLVWLGDPTDALRWYERDLSHPRRGHDWQGRVLAQTPGAYAHLGELAEARRRLANQGPTAFEQAVEMLASPLLAFFSGHWEEAAAAWEAVRECARRTGVRLAQIDFALWLARLYQLQGEYQRADALAEESLAVALDGQHLPFELRARIELALLVAERGDLSAAQAHVERCQAVLAAGEDWRGLAGRVRLAEAVVAAASGDHPAAAERFAEAHQIFQRYTLPWEEAEGLHLWGRALLAAGQPRQALATFSDALAVYDRIGAADRWREHVLADLARAEQLQQRRPSRPRYPDGLSEREVQVLRLVAAGRSNPEIAAALVLSRYTVDRHVNHILAKTGTANRVEAATYAHRRGLARL